jgi:hypothetical protein
MHHARRAFSSTASGDGFELLGLQNRLRLFAHTRELGAIRASICYFVRNDQVMLRIDRDLHIVPERLSCAKSFSARLEARRLPSSLEDNLVRFWDLGSRVPSRENC